MWRIGLFVLCPLLLIACSEDKIINTTNNTVTVTFDLHNGFEERTFSILVDTIFYFQASLSPAVPFAGPVARFRTILTREKHILKVSWSDTWKIDSVEFTLGQSSQYFIGLELRADTLLIEVRDEPYLYGCKEHRWLRVA
jgi:hypothetical protein